MCIYTYLPSHAGGESHEKKGYFRTIVVAPVGVASTYPSQTGGRKGHRDSEFSNTSRPPVPPARCDWTAIKTKKIYPRSETHGCVNINVFQRSGNAEQAATAVLGAVLPATV